MVHHKIVGIGTLPKQTDLQLLAASEARINIRQELVIVGSHEQPSIQHAIIKSLSLLTRSAGMQRNVSK